MSYSQGSLFMGMVKDGVLCPNDRNGGGNGSVSKKGESAFRLEAFRTASRVWGKDTECTWKTEECVSIKE